MPIGSSLLGHAAVATDCGARMTSALGSIRALRFRPSSMTSPSICRGTIRSASTRTERPRKRSRCGCRVRWRRITLHPNRIQSRSVRGATTTTSSRPSSASASEQQLEPALQPPDVADQHRAGPPAHGRAAVDAQPHSHHRVAQVPESAGHIGRPAGKSLQTFCGVGHHRRVEADAGHDRERLVADPAAVNPPVDTVDGHRECIFEPGRHA